MKQFDQNLLNILSKWNRLIRIYWTICQKGTVWLESIEQSVKREQCDQNLLNNLSNRNSLIRINWTICQKGTVWSESIEQSIKRKQFDQNLLNNLSKIYSFIIIYWKICPNPLVPKAIFFIQFQNPFKDSFVWVKTEFHFFVVFLKW